MKFPFFTKKKPPEGAEKKPTEGKKQKKSPVGDPPKRKVARDISYLKNGKDVPGVTGGWLSRLGLDIDYLVGGLTQLFIALLSVGAILYFGQYLYSTLSSGVSVTEIYPISETLTCEGQAFLIRDETVITQKESGYLSYSVSDGARVGKGEEVAGIYANDISAQEKRLAELEQERALLVRSLFNTGVLDALSEVSGEYARLMQLSAAQNWSAYADGADDFREMMNRSAAFSGTASSLTDRVNALEEQIAAARNAFGTAKSILKAPEKGYYFYGNDGYETLVSTNVVNGFTEESYRSLLALQPESTDGRAGVLVSGQKWYLAVEVPGNVLEEKAVGATCRVLFPASGNRELSMRLETRITTENSTVLLLGADVIPEGFSWARTCKVQIVTDELEGLRIPASALHTEDGLTGVYTLHGKNVLFRRISVVYEGTGYSVAAVRGESGFTEEKTYRVISYPFDCAAGTTADFTDFCAVRGASRRCCLYDGSLGEGTQNINNVLFMRRGNRGKAISYRDTEPHYAYLDGQESVIIAGRDLYHGKVVS